MNDDLQNNTKKVMSLVVTIVLLTAGGYFIMYAPDRGEIAAGIDFNSAMGVLFIILEVAYNHYIERSVRRKYGPYPEYKGDIAA